MERREHGQRDMEGSRGISRAPATRGRLRQATLSRESHKWPLGGTANGAHHQLAGLTIIGCMLAAACALNLCLLPQVHAASSEGTQQAVVSPLAASTAQAAADQRGANTEQQQQQEEEAAALEAELNDILRQHDVRDANSKLLSEAIISRLMLGNLSDSSGPSNEAIGGEGLAQMINRQLADLVAAAAATAASDETPQSLQATNANNEETSGGGEQQQRPINRLSGPEVMRLRKLFGTLASYELGQMNNAGLNGGQAFSQYPVLPAGQAATIKRATTAKMSNYLRQQQAHQRQLANQAGNSYGRNTFDFGLGKRPDSSMMASNILRLGDSSLAAGPMVPGSAHLVAVSGSQFGKRPSAHRYDFGLGKRVASPTYPRYDFGLGKRAPNRIRYDFGLGK